MTKTSNKEGYIPFLDGCRGYAIAVVLIAHAGLDKLIPGGFGVTIFFFISGYLITKLLIGETAKTGRIHLVNFYLRRFFRLYPALILFILAGYIAAFAMHCAVSGKDILSALFYFTNYYIGWIRVPVPDCSRIFDIIWSLSVEEHFYLFFPFLSYLFLVPGQKKQPLYFAFVLLGLCALALLFRYDLVAQHVADPENGTGRIYFSTHTRMDSILWGCLSALLVFKLKAKFYLHALNSKVYLMAGIGLLLACLLLRSQVFRDTLRFSLQGIGLMMVIPALERMQNGLTKTIFQNRLIIFIGKISYSLYLFHWIVLKLASHYLVEFSLQWQLCYWIFSLALSLFSFYLVEKPFAGLRRRFGSHVTTGQ